MMIRESVKHGLAEPAFEQRGDEFVVTLWRDWLTEAVLDELGVTARQRKALEHLRVQGRLRSAEYQSLTGSSRQTASRDLEDLVRKGLLVRVGEGRGSHYVKAREMPRK